MCATPVATPGCVGPNASGPRPVPGRVRSVPVAPTERRPFAWPPWAHCQRRRRDEANRGRAPAWELPASGKRVLGVSGRRGARVHILGTLKVGWKRTGLDKAVAGWGDPQAARPTRPRSPIVFFLREAMMELPRRRARDLPFEQPARTNEASLSERAAGPGQGSLLQTERKPNLNFEFVLVRRQFL